MRFKYVLIYGIIKNVSATLHKTSLRSLDKTNYNFLF